MPGLDRASCRRLSAEADRAATKLERCYRDYDASGRQMAVSFRSCEELEQGIARLLRWSAAQVLRITREAAAAFPRVDAADADIWISCLEVGVEREGRATSVVRVLASPGSSPIEKRRLAEPALTAELKHDLVPPGYPHDSAHSSGGRGVNLYD